ncbi:hypothetical protein B0H14DRAFT_3756876 [Mycena olivaceomarginata]|nr:hypothetical protein B0H14DRAFT_3756876 [Mycena olivaceomarginata]
MTYVQQNRFILCLISDCLQIKTEENWAQWILSFGPYSRRVTELMLFTTVEKCLCPFGDLIQDKDGHCPGCQLPIVEFSDPKQVTKPRHELPVLDPEGPEEAPSASSNLAPSESASSLTIAPGTTLPAAISVIPAPSGMSSPTSFPMTPLAPEVSVKAPQLAVPEKITTIPSILASGKATTTSFIHTPDNTFVRRLRRRQPEDTASQNVSVPPDESTEDKYRRTSVKTRSARNLGFLITVYMCRIAPPFLVPAADEWTQEMLRDRVDSFRGWLLTVLSSHMA